MSNQRDDHRIAGTAAVRTRPDLLDRSGDLVAEDGREPASPQPVEVGDVAAADRARRTRTSTSATPGGSSTTSSSVSGTPNA
jgi:hypothetical protein